MSKRPFGLAVAQMGPVQPQETRSQTVARLLAMMREAHARGARLVVFPELALTTFFPRYWMSEEEAMERYFQKEMPCPDPHAVRDGVRARRRLLRRLCLARRARPAFQHT